MNKHRHTHRSEGKHYLLTELLKGGGGNHWGKKKQRKATANQTVLEGSIDFTGRGAASAREGGVEGWDTLGLLERGSGTPRVALQGREHSPEGALLFPIVNISLQLAERAHGAAQHRAEVTQDGALMRKCHHVKNPSWLSTHRATQHRFPPSPPLTGML